MSQPKRALITGITGQDGSYLTEFLLEQGYDVYGLVRRVSSPSDGRIAHLHGRMTLLSADLLDEASLVRALQAARPHEVYNLAAQSFVQTSFTEPTLTGDIIPLGVTRLLEAVRHVDPTIRFYQASSSEMVGKVREVPQRETTPFHPRSPYGVASRSSRSNWCLLGKRHGIKTPPARIERATYCLEGVWEAGQMIEKGYGTQTLPY